jgi:hypothetical protein
MSWGTAHFGDVDSRERGRYGCPVAENPGQDHVFVYSLLQERVDTDTIQYVYVFFEEKEAAGGRKGSKNQGV